VLSLGGIAALLLAIGYVAIIRSSHGGAPRRREAWFPTAAKQRCGGCYLAFVVTICFICRCLGAVDRLRKAGTKLMLAAIVCLHLFVVLDLAVTWTHHASLLALFQNYSSAADELIGSLSGCGRICLLDLCDAAVDLLHYRDSISGRAAGEHHDDQGKFEGERLDGLITGVFEYCR